jgi:hypothetical protein
MFIIEFDRMVERVVTMCEKGEGMVVGFASMVVASCDQTKVVALLAGNIFRYIGCTESHIGQTYQKLLMVSQNCINIEKGL